jgi:uncharacterized protein (DUF1330 family)
MRSRKRDFQPIKQAEDPAMKSYVTVGLSMLAGAALGATAIETIHAQAKPLAFLISENTINDQDVYMKQFIPAVSKTMEATGAKFLARGGKIETLLGSAPPPRTVVLQFPSMDKALEWWNSQATKDAIKIGQKSADIRQYIIEGLAQ